MWGKFKKKKKGGGGGGVEEVVVPLAGVSQSVSRLLEPLLVHAKQEWQQDSAKEVSPFTGVSWLQWGQGT